MTVTGKSFRKDRWNLGAWRWVGTAVVLLYALLAVVLPGAQLVIGALQPYFGAPFGQFTMDNIVAALTTPALVDAIGLTIGLAFVCGIGAAVFAALASYLIARRRSKLRRLLELALWLPWAVPGVVLSLAFAWAVLAVPGLRTLYGTPWILGAALIVSAVPVAMRPVQGAIAQLSKELEDASRTNGASGTRTFFTVVLRIILPSFVAAWFVSAILVAGQLAVPTLLSGLDNKTVPILVFQMYNQGDAAASSALLLVHLTAMYLSIGLLWVIYRIVVAIVNRARVRRRNESEPVPTGGSAAVPTGITRAGVPGTTQSAGSDINSDSSRVVADAVR